MVETDHSFQPPPDKLEALESFGLVNGSVNLCGADGYYRVFYGVDALLVTDGVQLLAEIAESHWLNIEILTHARKTWDSNDPFLAYRFRKCVDGFWRLERSTGNDDWRTVKKLTSTTFPLAEQVFYVCQGEHGLVMMLPQEY